MTVTTSDAVGSTSSNWKSSLYTGSRVSDFFPVELFPRVFPFALSSRSTIGSLLTSLPKVLLPRVVSRSIASSDVPHTTRTSRPLQASFLGARG